jgi:patatin-like phospholipase/acyl hydrolase
MAVERILSIDGGGIRGIVPTIVLQRLAREPDLDFLDRVDLVAGTSTGGLIALAVAAGIELERLREMYEERGAAVFADSVLDDVADLGKVLGADYDISNLRLELRHVFADLTLAQLPKRVVVPAFDLDNEDPVARTWKPKIFHNFPGPDSDGVQLAYKVGTYTSAAPTYFPTEDGYIDGGVFAANPSMCALAQVLDSRVPKNERADLSDVRLLSLGTGRSLVHVEGDSLDWGYVEWVRPLLGLILDGTSGIADYQCRQMLGERYFRLAPTFPADKEIAMDDVDQVPYLVEFAERVDLVPLVAWLRSNWR